MILEVRDRAENVVAVYDTDDFDEMLRLAAVAISAGLRPIVLTRHGARRIVTP